MRERRRRSARPRAAPAFAPSARREVHGKLAPPIVEEVLRSSGQALDGATRAALEPRFGHDIARVRVHTDERAARSARAVGAAAYTVGRDIVFDSGEFAPHSAEGRRLLAHELSHVAQQTPRHGAPLRVMDDPALEAGAHAAAARGAPAADGVRAPAGALQRQPRRGPIWSAKQYINAGMGYFDFGPFSSINPEGDYDTSDDTNRPFSEVFTGRLCTKERLPLDFAFHVDSHRVARPQPFASGHVSMTLRFLTERGRTIPIVSDTSTTQYLKQGLALLTGMPLSVAFAPPEPGTLLVSLAHMDPSSGELAVYSDEIPVVDCEPEPPNDESRETRFFAVVPDPVNAPHDYELLGKQSSIMEPDEQDKDKPRGVITRIEQDQWGYFYVHVLEGKSRRIYIEDPNTK